MVSVLAHWIKIKKKIVKKIVITENVHVPKYILNNTKFKFSCPKQNPNLDSYLEAPLAQQWLILTKNNLKV